MCLWRILNKVYIYILKIITSSGSILGVGEYCNDKVVFLAFMELREQLQRCDSRNNTNKNKISNHDERRKKEQDASRMQKSAREQIAF